jgi:hypothetical protein
MDQVTGQALATFKKMSPLQTVPSNGRGKNMVYPSYVNQRPTVITTVPRMLALSDDGDEKAA